jgi:hypothetical protein
MAATARSPEIRATWASAAVAPSPLEPLERTSPTEKNPSTEPEDPIDRIEPAEAMDRIDPALERESRDPTEAKEPNDPTESTDAADSTENAERYDAADASERREATDDRLSQPTAAWPAARAPAWRSGCRRPPDRPGRWLDGRGDQREVGIGRRGVSQSEGRAGRRRAAGRSPAWRERCGRRAIDQTLPEQVGVDGFDRRPDPGR